MRAFIGFKLDDCQMTILKIISELKKQDIHGNYTLANNIHLTLVFLGDISANEVDKVKKILDSIDYNEFPLEITLMKKLKDIVVLEVNKNNSLMSYQKQLQNRLLAEGFKIDNRPYYPHITLVRKNNDLITRDMAMNSVAREAILFSSSRINNVLTYTPIYKRKLGK